MKSNDFLSEDIASDAHEMHLDHEVQMARKDCYTAADDAIALHKLLRNVSEQQGLEGWVAAKITLASDYLKTVREHLEYQLMSQVPAATMELPLAEGYYDLDQGNVPGMEPIDFSTKPSFKELVDRYTQLVYQGHTSETSPEEDQEYDAIEQYVAKRFGEKGSAHLQKAGEVSYWGRDDKPFGRDSRSSNLGRPNQPGGDFRTTKAGKMHGQDAKMMKGKVADRLGKHPAPNLPESLADEFMAMAKAKGMNPRLRGTPDEERARTDAMLTQRAADRAAAPAPAGPDAEERAKLQARLKELEAKFDPNFEYSDDHSFWTEQNSISKQINAIKQRLLQNVSETSAGSVAGVVNPTPKNKAKVGTLFGGTYKQKKTKA